MAGLSAESDNCLALVVLSPLAAAHVKVVTAQLTSSILDTCSCGKASNMLLAGSQDGQAVGPPHKLGGYVLRKMVPSVSASPISK